MKGLLFSPEMARAVCEGRKTQTRRCGGLALVNAAPNAWVFSHISDHRIALFDAADGSPSRAHITLPYHPGEKVAMLATWATT